jgi:dihydrofolate reductase
MIAAMSADRVIGHEDGLPWDVPADYEHFVASVRGGAVVMGRRSYGIFGGDLEDVRAIVVTRSEHAPAGSQRAGDVETALAQAAASGRPVWVAGGASIYEQALPYADELHLSIVPGTFEGDAWFPAWDERAWALAEEAPRDGYVFRRYVRIAQDPS